MYKYYPFISGIVIPDATPVLGWFIGSFLCGFISQKFGPKATLILSCFLYGIGFAIQAICNDIWTMCLARTVTGKSRVKF